MPGCPGHRLNYAALYLPGEQYAKRTTELFSMEDILSQSVLPLLLFEMQLGTSE